MTKHTMSPTLAGSRRRLTIAAAAAALTAGALPTTLAPVDAAAAPTRDSSAFGELRYAGSDHCSADTAATPQAEVAFVENRIIVQTNEPGHTRRAIDDWRIDNPPAASPQASITARHSLSSRVATTVDGVTRVADSIDFTRLNALTGDDEPGQAPVVAFDLPGDMTHDIVSLARHLTTDHELLAAPDYVTPPSGPYDFFQPDGLPQSTTESVAQRDPFVAGGRDLGSGVDIMVFDTGLAPAAASGTMPNVSALRPIDREQPDRDGDGVADDGWVGHGLAISSEIAGLVPGATVRNVRVTRGGLSTDFTSAKAIVDTLDLMPPGRWPDLLVASFGTMACDLDPTAPGDELVPVSLRAATDVVEQLSTRARVDMVIVAAAGNHGTARKEYPAAFDNAVSVGALDATLDADGDPLTSVSRTAPVADFSARGAWVDLWAPGNDIVTSHVDDLWFESDGAAELIEGRAVVQGTSFAAPYVAAQLAELMSTNGVTSSPALAQLTASGVAPQPACDGTTAPAQLTGVAVALADLDTPSDQLATGPAVDVC